MVGAIELKRKDRQVRRHDRADESARVIGDSRFELVVHKTDSSVLLEGRTIGRVVRVAEFRDDHRAMLLTERELVEASLPSRAELESVIEVTGVMQSNGSIRADEVKKLEGKQAEEANEKIENALNQRAKPMEANFFIRDEATEKMKDDVENVAFALKKALLGGRPVLMRYHGDADGISGGVMLRKAIAKIVWDVRNGFWSFQNDSAVYKNKHALKDISWFSSLNYESIKPLLLLVDFGANAESADALKLVKKTGVQVIVVDHHPPGEETKQSIDAFVSPWNVKGLANASQYTAGMLAGEVAKRISEVDVEELQQISLTGDKSKLIEPTEELKKKSTALDFLATYSKFPNSLDFYEKVLNDEEMVKSIFEQANNQIEKMKEAAREFTKQKQLENGFTLCTVKLDAAAKKGEFPSKGKATGRIHDEIEKTVKGPLVTIGYGSKFINVRANKQATENGFDANKIIQEIKEELRGAIEAGGGHAAASGIRINPGFGKIVLEELTKKIEAIKKMD